MGSSNSPGHCLGSVGVVAAVGQPGRSCLFLATCLSSLGMLGTAKAVPSVLPSGFRSAPFYR